MPKKHSSDSEEEEFYDVERIVNRRMTPLGVEYEVKWKGFPSSQNTWEPEASLSLAQEAIAAYDAEIGKHPPNEVTMVESDGDEPPQVPSPVASPPAMSPPAHSPPALSPPATPFKRLRMAGSPVKRMPKHPPRRPAKQFDDDFLVDDDDEIVQYAQRPKKPAAKDSARDGAEDVTVTGVKEVNGALVWTALLRDGAHTVEMTVEQLKKRAPLALIDYLVSKLRFA